MRVVRVELTLNDFYGTHRNCSWGLTSKFSGSRKATRSRAFDGPLQRRVRQATNDDGRVPARSLQSASGKEFLTNRAGAGGSWEIELRVQPEPL